MHRLLFASLLAVLLRSMAAASFLPPPEPVESNYVATAGQNDSIGTDWQPTEQIYEPARAEPESGSSIKGNTEPDYFDYVGAHFRPASDSRLHDVESRSSRDDRPISSLDAAYFKLQAVQCGHFFGLDAAALAWHGVASACRAYPPSYPTGPPFKSAV